MLFSRFWPRFLQQIRLHKNHNCETVASYHGSKWSSTELVHCRKVKLRSCTSFPRAIQVWVGEDQVFLIVDLTFHGQWHTVPVRYQPPCSGRFACLGSHPSLANSRGRECWSCKKQGAKYFLPRCACYLAYLSRDLYGCADLGKSAAQESQLWDSRQLPWFKMVLKRDCTVQKKWSCEVVGSHPFSQDEPGLFCFWEDLSFLIVDLTFHGQWDDIVPVHCQPPCSGTFAFLGSHTGFANRKCHRCRNCSDPFESSTAKLVAAIVQTGSNAQKSEAAKL